MDKITKILENVVRCKYFEAGGHIKNPIKNSYQDGLGRTFDPNIRPRCRGPYILIWDKRKSQINQYSDTYVIHDYGHCVYVHTCKVDVPNSEWNLKSASVFGAKMNNQHSLNNI